MSGAHGAGMWPPRTARRSRRRARRAGNRAMSPAVDSPRMRRRAIPARGKRPACARRARRPCLRQGAPIGPAGAPAILDRRRARPAGRPAPTRGRGRASMRVHARSRPSTHIRRATAAHLRPHMPSPPRRRHAARACTAASCLTCV
ncbi:conserved hypothetical protein [Burkholderia pseudomallei Pakistan 9]|nr:conserved hypothetical protein [Burkholderia pseudomallei Pakistan 9]